MSIVAEFSLPRTELLLAGVPREWSGRVEFERLVPTTAALSPFVRVRGDVDAFVGAVDADPSVAELVEIDDAPPWTRFRLAWSRTGEAEFRSLFDGVVVLSAAAADETWTFRFRFPDSESVSAFHAEVSAAELPLELRRLTDESRDAPSESRLTERQRETLVIALERGYFEVPRTATLADLGVDLGVSKQAVSERLRRAVHLLVSDAVER